MQLQYVLNAPTIPKRCICNVLTMRSLCIHNPTTGISFKHTYVVIQLLNGIYGLIATMLNISFPSANQRLVLKKENWKLFLD